MTVAAAPSDEPLRVLWRPLQDFNGLLKGWSEVVAAALAALVEMFLAFDRAKLLLIRYDLALYSLKFSDDYMEA
ncbi:hypothetical protein F2P81_021147 [Scophthalmus maximus]|uniref:Uncharacterized protein n=1 Tax=Scophthalmus maximus TaxID=52904 RepID=A0A6A4S450_SCOMX|nr:hypothetical protein F2P81_021147 [Scophthalmus maximus]